jgi:hypothetical protein
MVTVSLILQVAAFVLLVLATIGIPSPQRFSLGWGGLACWLLSELLGKIIFH